MLQAGQPLIASDTQTDPLTAPFYEPHYRPLGIVARVGVPLLREGKLAATLWASKDRPYDWSQQEISLLETVASRAWLAFEKAGLNRALRTSEERFRLASRAFVGLIYDWQVETDEAYRSEGIEQVTGVPWSETPPVMAWWRQRIHPDDLPALDKRLDAALQGTAGGYEFEYRVRHEDGRWITLWDRGYIIRDARGKAIRVVGSAADITQRKQAEIEREQLLAALEFERAQLKGLNENLEQQVQVRTAQVRHLASALTLTEQQERRQLARELHDSAGQLLTALQIYLKLIVQDVPAGLDELREKMADAVKMAQEAQQEVRAVSHAMRPPALDQLGLSVALEELCHDFARRTSFQVTYQSDELPALDDRVGLNVSLNYYRFLQEALNNAAKHSQATLVEVNLGYLDGELLLMVEDNGIGFDVATLATASHKGMGLQNLQERFYLLGGQVEIHSQPGRGTRLVARRTLETFTR
jgi:signal transduction histidine kinase